MDNFFNLIFLNYCLYFSFFHFDRLGPTALEGQFGWGLGEGLLTPLLAAGCKQGHECLLLRLAKSKEEKEIKKLKN